MRANFDFRRLLVGLNPMVLALASVATLATGMVLQGAENRENRGKAAALMAGPPAALAVEELAARLPAHPFDEVTVTAQLDIGSTRLMTVATPTGRERAAAIPLVPVGAQPGDRAIALALFTAADFSFAEVAQSGFLAFSDRIGPLGPILTLNGREGDLGVFGPAVAERQLRGDLAVPPGAPVIAPFLRGRAAAYEPWSHFGRPAVTLFAPVTGLLAFLALLRAAIHLGGYRTTPLPPLRDLEPLSPLLRQQRDRALKEKRAARRRWAGYGIAGSAIGVLVMIAARAEGGPGPGVVSARIYVDRLAEQGEVLALLLGLVALLILAGSRVRNRGSGDAMG